jgi:hypothetical protein
MPTPKELCPKLPNEAERTIMKAMQLKSENRHQNIHEFMDDLRNIKPSKPVKEWSTRKWYISIAIALVVLLIGIGVWRHYSTNMNTTNDNISIPVEELFEQALSMMNNTDPSIFYEGHLIMDSLSQAEYIPAMHEMAYTFGWYSDSSSLRRKDMLGIKYEREKPLTKYMPINDNDNQKAMYLMVNILKKNDSNYPNINGDAAYRLAGYYLNKGTFVEGNREKGREYLEESEKWASLTGDTMLLAKIENGKRILK